MLKRRDRCCVSIYINRLRTDIIKQRTASRYVHTLLAKSLILLGLTIGGNSLQTDLETKVDLLKSLIYDNTKATVTLDSAALKQLIQFSSGNLWNNFIPLSHIFSSLIPMYNKKYFKMLIVYSLF